MAEVVLDLVPVLEQRPRDVLDRLELTADRPCVPAREVPPRRPRRLEVEDRHGGLLELPRPRHPMHALAQDIERLPCPARERAWVPQPIEPCPLERGVAFGSEPPLLAPPHLIHGLVQAL